MDVERAATPQIAWLDRLKAVALAWIVLNHLVERLFGYPHIANPTAGWPPLAERIAQLAPLTGHGIWDLPLTLLRALGWFGDQGVQLFLIASGFGLTWGLLARGGPARLPARSFLLRRLARVYPEWWAAHLLFAATWLLLGWGLSPLALESWASAAGLRLTPGLLYYFCPAWWFFGLIVQLYLVFPLLWRELHRRGPLGLLIVWGSAALAIRGIGLLTLEEALDFWQRGGLFVTRLPEFLLGMALASWLHRDGARCDRRLRSPALLGLAAAGYAAGTALSLTLAGMTVAPLLLGASAFVLLYAALRATERLATAAGAWIGRHSYSLYLAHHVPILLLVPAGGMTLREAAPGSLAALALTVPLALCMEWLAAAGGRLWRACRERRYAAPLGAAGAGALLLGAALGGELLVRRLDPQEVWGWGERPALAPDPEFGWKLAPSRSTRLRWLGYDYEVTASDLGFPAPSYPVERTPGSLRVLTVGDAFTSAEGVDTGRSWPRLLEPDLARRLGRPVEVLNFAITGYGPRQNAAVVERFAPLYRPDEIVVSFFVNDFEDVTIDDEAFRRSIGFGGQDPAGVRGLVARGHLRQFVQLRLAEPLAEILWGRPRPSGYFLGNFSALERAPASRSEEAVKGVESCLARIRAAAAGARVSLVLVPAPVQVCGPEDLDYFPRGVDLADRSRFDPDGPQRAAVDIARALDLRTLDLREPLRQGDCPYHPGNMHWTAAGHEIVARVVADFLAAGGP